MTSVANRYAVPPAAGAHPSAAADEALAPVVLMVSGGADSTALLVLAATSALDIGDGRGTARIARERLHVLHVNHQLRGLDAEEDEEFVRDMAERYGIPCTVRRVDVAALAAAGAGHSGARADAARREDAGQSAARATRLAVGKDARATGAQRQDGRPALVGGEEMDNNRAMDDSDGDPALFGGQNPSWRSADTGKSSAQSSIAAIKSTEGGAPAARPCGDAAVTGREAAEAVRGPGLRADAGASASAVPACASGNIEAAGREVRYAAAAALANELSAATGTPRSAARILTAHTANDRAETFFMNALRGAGPSGLSSIPRQRGRVVRPLLDRTHAELCELLRMRGIVWREDATNADTSRLRAFVRHEVLPPLVARNPRVMSSVATTCDILSDEDAYLTQLAARSLRELTRRQASGLAVLDARRLAATDVALARRIVRACLLGVCPDARLEARHVAAVLACVARGSGSVSVPVDVDARVDHGLLFVRARAGASGNAGGEAQLRGKATDEAAARGAFAAWLEVPGHREQPSGRSREDELARALAEIERADVAHAAGGRAVTRARYWAAPPLAPKPRRRSAPRQAPDGPAPSLGRLPLPDGRALTARLLMVPPGERAPELARAHATEHEGASVLLDAVACGIDPTSGGCLWVDTPAPGDVLCPLGMHGQSKKLSDLLGEARVPVAERAAVPVVRSGPTGRVLWVAGIRPDERARAQPGTRLLLELALESPDAGGSCEPSGRAPWPEPRGDDPCP